MSIRYIYYDTACVFLHPFTEKVYCNVQKSNLEAKFTSRSILCYKNYSRHEEVTGFTRNHSLVSNVLINFVHLFWQALVRIMNLRKYSGRVQFVPAPGYEECGEPIKKVDVRKSDDNLSQEGQRNNAKPYCRSYHGPSVEFEDSEWRSLDGPFISAWVNNVPWCAEDFMSAPEAKVTPLCTSDPLNVELPLSSIALSLEMLC